MEDTRERILDAAQHRIRIGGYCSFSFREIAADIGVKSSSVHHHFPTKEVLGAAVAKRYTDRFYASLEALEGAPECRLRVAFAAAIANDGQMCLCGVLGAEASALPAVVALEAREFFRRGVGFLVGDAQGALRNWALQILSLLEGAMVLTRALGEPNAFEGATALLPARPETGRTAAG